MQITIVGAGIAGLSAAIALKKGGIKATLFEAATQLKPAGAGLGLAPNAVNALRKLGIEDAVLALGRELDSFSVTDRKGKIISRISSARQREHYGVASLTIHRAKLHQALLKELPPGSIFTGKPITTIRRKGQRVQLSFGDGSTHETDYLLAADGINSRVRNWLVPAATKRYAGYTCWRGVAQAPDIGMNKAVEIWDAKGRLGIVPLPDGQIYWFACMNAREGDKKIRQVTVEYLRHFFENFHPLAGTIISRTPEEQLIHNDIYDIAPLSSYAYDNILLLGDAAHAATPNMAQGACQAIEDAAVLASVLGQTDTYTAAFKEFERRRLERTHYIIDQSGKLGRLAQLSNPILVALRNKLLPLVPQSIQEKQLAKLYDVVL